MSDLTQSRLTHSKLARSAHDILAMPKVPVESRADEEIICGLLLFRSRRRANTS
jgi:hypothetical protein